MLCVVSTVPSGRLDHQWEQEDDSAEKMFEGRVKYRLGKMRVFIIQYLMT